MRQVLERVASNEALFAAANDAAAVVAGTPAPQRVVPFRCECPDPRCAETAELSLGEYAAVRLFANRFLVSSRCRGRDHPGTMVVERHERYSVVDRVAAI